MLTIEFKKNCSDSEQNVEETEKLTAKFRKETAFLKTTLIKQSTKYETYLDADRSKSPLENDKSRLGVTGLGVVSGALLADVGRLPEPLLR